MPRLPRLHFLFAATALLAAGAALHAEVPSAKRALLEGRVEEATSLLQPWIADHPADAEAHLLLCRAFYAESLADPAITQCEAATAAAPSSSEAELWLGRAYGMKAVTVNPVQAFALARKVRDSFERAVQLDPSNLAAISDLGEFYVAAPAIVGGGAGKARSLAQRLHGYNRPDAEVLGHRILGLLAEKDADLTTAEAEFRSAASGNYPPAWVDLAAFFARHHQPDQAAAAVRSAVHLDQTHGPILVDAAGVLVEAGREPDLTIRLLRQYLASPAKSDAAPAFKVHLQLGNLLSKAGDGSAARNEYAEALNLAPNYAPARKAGTASVQPVNR